MLLPKVRAGSFWIKSYKCSIARSRCRDALVIYISHVRRRTKGSININASERREFWTWSLHFYRKSMERCTQAVWPVTNVLQSNSCANWINLCYIEYNQSDFRYVARFSEWLQRGRVLRCIGYNENYGGKTWILQLTVSIKNDENCSFFGSSMYKQWARRQTEFVELPAACRRWIRIRIFA